MLKSIRTPTSALVASLAIAVGAMGASATPARADNGDAARIIGGLIALYAVGRIIHESRDNDRPRGHQPHRPRLVAPSRCFIEGHGYNGYFRGYVRRCMQNNAQHANLLPRQCLRRVQTHRGQRHIYGGRCLFQNGWTRG